ncbi:porin [Halomonas sp. Mc5H-6]|uniref:porin n=1 Tax=Halomonas sp. Mc5H-6 TaxID=2954500 RepID=UPI002096DBBB|nr:porin [Halomonas sp. Mc5H-6]
MQNPSSAVNPESKNISGEFKDRHFNVFLEGAAGSFSLGQGDGAANGNIEADLSGTNVVSSANLPLVGGGLPFVNKGSMEEIALKNSVSNQDFESRYSRFRYDTPSLGPIELSVSQGVKSNSDVTELGGRISLPLAGRVVARLGYSTKGLGETSGDVETIGGSISWLHTSGFNLTGAYSNRADDNGMSPDSEFYWAKAGYRFNEAHAIDAHYAETKDLRLKGDHAETVGVGYVYKPSQWLDIYAGYRRHSLSGVNAEYSNVNVAMFGSRIKF